jgi:hypothetical protein
VLKRHFLEVKKAFDLKKYMVHAFSDIIRYIWAKFEQNRFFSRGRLMFDFCGHPLLKATEKLRLSEGSNKLFLSFQRLHRPVAKASITRWLCDVLI